jgi:DNA-binding GntR family transcriptional regulator
VLAEGAGNQHLAEILGSLARQTRRYSKLGLTSVVRRRESARTWRAMADALKAGDFDGAAAAVEQLIHASGREATRKLLAKQARARQTHPIKDIHP